MASDLNALKATRVHAEGARVDPLRGYRFIVENELHIRHAGFTGVEGLTARSAVEEYVEGANGRTVRKLPGEVIWGDVTLSRGVLIGLSDTYDWADVVLNDRNNNLLDQTFRTDTIIKLYNRDASYLEFEWVLTDSWVSSYEIKGINATSGEILMDNIVLTHEGFSQGTVRKRNRQLPRANILGVVPNAGNSNVSPIP